MYDEFALYDCRARICIDLGIDIWGVWLWRGPKEDLPDVVHDCSPVRPRPYRDPNSRIPAVDALRDDPEKKWFCIGRHDGEKVIVRSKY